jgi:hypothetical protein
VSASFTGPNTRYSKGARCRLRAEWGRTVHTIFCECFTCAQARVRPGIVVKGKVIIHVSVRTNSADALLQLKFPCTARDVL